MNKLISSKWLFAFVIFLSTACSPYLKYFETAQDAFNKAAEAENTLKLDPGAGIAISPESQYRIARTYIMKAMGDVKDEKEKHDKTNLSRDGLLLNAYTIKGLSEWKLGMYQRAIATASDCKLTFQSNNEVQNQRDYIVMMCLEALVYNDSIEKYIRKLDEKNAKSELTNKDESSLANLSTAFEIIKSQRTKLDEAHPVQRYLIISQLSVAKNWKNLRNKLIRQLRGGNMALYNEKYKAKWEEDKNKLNEDLMSVLTAFQGTLENGKENPLYKQWKEAHSDVSMN